MWIKMNFGTCEKCGYPMRLKATDGSNIFIECSNPECDNKWRDELEWRMDVTKNE